MSNVLVTLCNKLASVAVSHPRLFSFVPGITVETHTIRHA